MYEVRVEADFAAAHFLKDFHGKCENLHGHNYHVCAHARGNVLDSGGMLLDFGILKGLLRDVCGELDHTCLNDMAVFNSNPSAERIAEYIFGQLENRLPAEGRALLYAVDVFETSSSRARYLRD